VIGAMMGEHDAIVEAIRTQDADGDARASVAGAQAVDVMRAYRDGTAIPPRRGKVGPEVMEERI
jgi:DNA-binding FadR family transcriptional regulator